MAADPPSTPSRGVWGMAVSLAAVVAVAFNLRTPITSLGALLTDVRTDLDFGTATAGFLTSAPTIMFALAGAAVPLLARHLSSTVQTGLALALVAAGAGLRVVAGTGWLVAGTLLATGGIAIVNVLLPAMVRNSFPRWQGWITGLYVAVLQLGAAVGAAAAVPLAAQGSWRGGLGWWLVPAVIALAVWMPASRTLRPDTGSTAPTASPATLTWATLARNRTALGLTVMFGVQSMAFYTVAGWLPTVLRGLGMSPEVAGTMNGIALGVMIPASLVVPAWVEGLSDQRWYIPAIGTPWLVGMGGLLVAPHTLTAVWMVCIGVGLMTFPVALLLISLRAETSQDTAVLSSFTQSIGYLIATPGPLLFGWLHDVSGSWQLPLVVLTAMFVPIAWGGFIAARPGHVIRA